MRLGCDVVVNDLNPVAWAVLKGTLDYPQRLASERHHSLSLYCETASS
jgi:putative DNA methylase